MKRILLLILILSMTFSFSMMGTAYAGTGGTVAVTSASAQTSGVTVKGTTTDVKAAVFVQVLNGTTLIAAQSFVVKDNAFTGTVSVTLTAGKTYNVRVADYDGGTWTKTAVTVPTSYTPYETPVDTSTKTDESGTDKTQIPFENLQKASEESGESLIVEDGDITLEIDSEAAAAIVSEADGKDIILVADKTIESESKIKVELYFANEKGEKISDFKGGTVKVTVPLTEFMKSQNLVSLFVNDQNIASKVSGAKSADGKTYTIDTGHFSTYIVTTEAAADEILAAQKADVQELIKNVKLKVTTKFTTKKSVQAKAVVSKGSASLTKLKDLGYTVEYRYFRSTKKASKYKSTITTKQGKTYTNTIGKKGQRYYYKACAVIKDANGSQIAITPLKASTYGTRIWKK